MHRRCLVLIALLFLLGACASKAPPPKPAPAPAPADSAAACLAGLDQRHVDYDRIADFHNGEGCGIDQAVKLRNPAIPLNRPLLMACPTAVNLADFEAQVVIPAAQETLGHTVTTVISAGSYDCRGQRGDHPERLSEHARGLAIDITGFTMDDGTRVTVLHNWSGRDAKADFLHRVAAGACKMFSVVLTPKTNKLHHDHLHLDNGRYRKCDA